ncbi:MAG TPA: c-type cytochrome, partial [Candidatus Sulfomarinibacteraceae bacterium]|nr:c-type cytochrome [Candidatus Sulfomarinibacteraceae bacterium]
TIVFAPLYVLFFHFGPGMLDIERYDQAMMLATEQQMAAILAMGEIDEAMLVSLMDDESMMNGGKKIYTSRCATCHGMFGEGGIGPNLTDTYWLHGAQLMDVYRTVREGVPAKGMLAWERQLRPAELLAVSSWVGSLLGTEPPNPKPPQGERVERAAPATTTVEEG